MDLTGSVGEYSFSIKESPGFTGTGFPVPLEEKKQAQTVPSEI